MLRRPSALLPHHGVRDPLARRRPQLRTTYVLAGPLRWVEPDGSRAVVRVDASNPAGRRFCGRSVTVELAGVRVTVLDPGHDRLRAGQVVTLRARLPRRLADLPQVVRPRTLVALGSLR